MKNILLRASAQLADRGQCDCDCDCACVSAPSPSFSKIPQSALWQKADDLYSFPLSPEYRMFRSSANGELAVLDLRAVAVLNDFSAPLPLEKAGASNQTLRMANQLAALGFLTPQQNSVCAPAPSPIPMLAAWLHLTDRCNLRCDYCYLPHIREDMSSETGRAAIDAIFRSAKINHFKQVKIKYAGGEPLLRYALILELHAYAKSLAGAYGLILEEVVLSNGALLTAKMAQTFKSSGIRLMISLDGLGDYHDSQRPYASGRGSFKDVAKAVELSLANGLAPTISVTVSSRTANGLPALVSWILERDLPFSLNFYRENDLSTFHQDMQLDEEKIIMGMLAVFKVIGEHLPKRSFLGSILDRANLSFPHAHTCAVGQNYLVFDQNGRVAKCQMQIQQPVTNVQAEDPLAAVRSDQAGVQNISVEEKVGCKNCEWKYWCAGGCPLETHRVTGRYDAKSPNCKIYKTILPEALRLEGLRLLKYADDPEVVTQM
jgi:uncharacterized protein